MNIVSINLPAGLGYPTLAPGFILNHLNHFYALISLALIAATTGCSDSSGNSSSRGSVKFTHPDLAEAEEDAARLISGYFEAIDRANNTANPLQAKQPDPEELERQLSLLLNPLFGRTLEFPAEVAGFSKRDGEVRVALMQPGWLDCFPDLKIRTLRLRLNSEDCAEIQLDTRMGRSEVTATNYMDEFASNVYLSILRPALDILSPMSLIAKAGKNIDLETARKLEVGTNHLCRIRVTEWKLHAPESSSESNFMGQMMAQDDPELLHLLQLQRQPCIILTCEWVNSLETPANAISDVQN